MILLCGCSTGAQATGPLSSEGTVILEWTSDRENRRQSSLGTKAEAACTVCPQLPGGQEPPITAARCIQSLHPASASHVHQLRNAGDNKHLENLLLSPLPSGESCLHSQLVLRNHQGRSVGSELAPSVVAGFPLSPCFSLPGRKSWAPLLWKAWFHLSVSLMRPGAGPVALSRHRWRTPLDSNENSLTLPKWDSVWKGPKAGFLPACPCWPR